MEAVAADALACPRCRGAGSLEVRVCCGRGCIDCVGEDLRRLVECRRCGGTGRLPPAAARRPSTGGAPPS